VNRPSFGELALPGRAGTQRHYIMFQNRVQDSRSISSNVCKKVTNAYETETDRKKTFHNCFVHNDWEKSLKIQKFFSFSP
jgi:hypothetical protein